MVHSFDSWETELYHHGILGQKWGIRRFQNEDGSLTPAGIKRQARYEAKIERAKIKADKIKQKAASSRKVSELSDSELQKKINRLKLEKQYKDLKTSSLKEGAALVNKYLNYRREKQEAALAKETRDREYEVLKTRLKMEDKELDIRREEAAGRKAEAEERTKQANASARQAEANAKQAGENARKEEATVAGMKTRAGRKKYKADLINAKTGLKAVKNKEKSMSLVNKILKRPMVKNWSTPEEYKDYAEMILNGGAKNKNKNKEGNNS